MDITDTLTINYFKPMKKLLILATAFVFAASTTVLVAQNPTGQNQLKKKTTAVKNEAQKPSVKSDSKAVAMNTKTSPATQPKEKAKKPKSKKPTTKAIKKTQSPEESTAPVQKQANPAKAQKPASPAKK